MLLSQQGLLAAVNHKISITATSLKNHLTNAREGKGRFFQNSAVIFGRKFCVTVPEPSQSVLPFDGVEDLMTILRVPSSQLLITGWVTGLCTDIDISPAVTKKDKGNAF